MTVTNEPTTPEDPTEATDTSDRLTTDAAAESRSELVRLLAQAYIHVPSLIP